MKSRRLYPFSTSGYALVFIGLCLVLFLVLGKHAQERIDAIRRVAEDNRTAAVEREVKLSIYRVFSEAHGIAKSFQDWDETFQQLQDPTYYPYWLESRALQRSRIPEYLLAAGLYNRDGVALAAPDELGVLPPAVPPTRVFLRTQPSTGHLYLFEPLVSRGDTKQTVGYVAVVLNFTAALRDLSQFTQFEPNDLTIADGAPNDLRKEAILEHLRYRVRRNDSLADLIWVMRSTLRDFLILGAALALLFYALMAFLVGRPLAELTRHVDDLRSGRSTPQNSGGTKPMPLRELEKLRLSLDHYQSELNTVHTRLDEKNRELWTLAHHDPLTGTLNRRAFETDWNRLRGLVSGQRLGVAFVLFDCDAFKAINDNYGHEVGDRVLQGIAESLGRALRQGDRLYRLGGDEFAALLLDAPRKAAEAIAQRCLEELSRHSFQSAGLPEPVRVSIGIACAEGTDQDQLFVLPRQADVAMYHAKGSQGQRLVVYHAGLDAEDGNSSPARFADATNRFLERAEGLEFDLGPVFALANGVPAYQRATGRLVDSQGALPDAELARYLRSRNLSSEVETKTMAVLLTQLESGALPPDGALSLRVSPENLADSRFIGLTGQLKLQLAPHDLVLEMDESVLDHKDALGVSRDLHRQGIKIALDGFATGYSSLECLAFLPASYISIRLSALSSLSPKHPLRRLLPSLVRALNRAGYRTVATEVDTPMAEALALNAGFTHLHESRTDTSGEPAALKVR